MTDKTLKTITVDGLSVDMTDTAAQVVDRALRNNEQALSDAQKKIETRDARVQELETQVAKDAADHKAAIEAKDAEIATLKSQLEDAAVTPERLDAMVKDREAVVDTAKKLMGDKLVVDGRSDADVRRQAVGAKLGDEKIKDWSDEQVRVSFDTLAATAKDADEEQRTTTSDAKHAQVGQILGDKKREDDQAEEARKKSEDRLRNAWKGGSDKNAA